MAETRQQVFVRILSLSYCVMPNHWHLVHWPLRDGDLGQFMQRLATTHVRRWHLHRRTVGTGHLCHLGRKKVIVRWTSGRTQTLKDVPANRLLILIEGQAPIYRRLRGIKGKGVN